jgi:hypothetical protein
MAASGVISKSSAFGGNQARRDAGGAPSPGELAEAFAGVPVGSSGVREASGWAITSLPSGFDDGCLIISLPTMYTHGEPSYRWQL